MHHYGAGSGKGAGWGEPGNGIGPNRHCRWGNSKKETNKSFFLLQQLVRSNFDMEKGSLIGLSP